MPTNMFKIEKPYPIDMPKCDLFCALNIGKDPNLTFIIKCVGDHIEYRDQVFKKDHRKSKKTFGRI